MRRRVKHKVLSKTPNKLNLFLEFLIFGVLVGLIEDIIAIKATTESTVTLNTVWIVLLVALPFAIIGELIVDRFEVFHNHPKKWVRRTELFLEFLIFGVIMGVVEDILAVVIGTGADVTMQMVLIIILITIPFAIFGELIVDKRELLG